MRTVDLQRRVFEECQSSLLRKLGKVDSTILRYRADPRSYYREKLGIELWDGAQKALNALAASPTARVGVVAGHGTQKTFSAAGAVQWFNYCWRPSVVITTAPTGRQVERLLWKDIRSQYLKAKRLDPSYPGKVLLKEWRGGPDWYAFGFASDEPQNVEGFHCPNILLVVDEAKGVADEIFEAFEGALSGVNARVLYISTAGHPEGEFYDSFTNDLFEHFTFSCEDMVEWYEEQGIAIPPGCTTRRWVEERADKWGRDSVRFKMRVMAQFCESIVDAIVPLEWVLRAKGNIRGPRRGRIRLGVDVAEFGDDLTVFFVGDDGGEIETKETEKQEITDTAGRVIRKIKQYDIDPQDVHIDTTGLGSGVGSICREKGYDVDSVHFAEKSTDEEEYADVIAEMYWGARKQFERKDFYISDHPSLVRDLTKRKYHTNSDGAYQIEKKKKFKDREGESPDYGDAFSLCYLNSELRAVKSSERL